MFHLGVTGSSELYEIEWFNRIFALSLLEEDHVADFHAEPSVVWHVNLCGEDLLSKHKFCKSLVPLKHIHSSCVTKGFCCETGLSQKRKLRK